MKYSALKTIIVIHKVLAALTLLAGLAIAVFGRGLEVLAGIVGGVSGSLVLYALSELIGLFISIEANTRKIAEKL